MLKLRRVSCFKASQVPLASPIHHTRVLGVCLVSFPDVMIRYPDNNNSGERGFISDHSSMIKTSSQGSQESQGFNLLVLNHSQS